MFYKFSHFFYLIAFKILYRFEITGTENELADGKMILACNHLSNLDPAVIAAGMKRQVHFLGKIELFKNPILRWYITQHNTHPVKRGKSDMGAMKTCIKVINEGNGLTIFPQGTRGADWDKAGDGVAFLAKKTGAKVLPAKITGSDEVLPKGKVLVRPFKKLKFAIGPAIELQEGEELKAFTKRVAEAITSL